MRVRSFAARSPNQTRAHTYTWCHPNHPNHPHHPHHPTPHLTRCALRMRLTQLLAHISLRSLHASDRYEPDALGIRARLHHPLHQSRRSTRHYAPTRHAAAMALTQVLTAPDRSCAPPTYHLGWYWPSRTTRGDKGLRRPTRMLKALCMLSQPAGRRGGGGH